MVLTLQEYNTAADRLQLIPTTAKRAGGMQFEARLNRGGSTSLEIMNVDLKVNYANVKHTLFEYWSFAPKQIKSCNLHCPFIGPYL